MQDQTAQDEQHGKGRGKINPQDRTEDMNQDADHDEGQSPGRTRRNDRGQIMALIPDQIKADERDQNAMAVIRIPREPAVPHPDKTGDISVNEGQGQNDLANMIFEYLGHNVDPGITPPAGGPFPMLHIVVGL